MSNDLARLMHSLLHSAAKSYGQLHWSPPVDIYRTRDGWLVKFDLAGVRAEDIVLKTAGRHLSRRSSTTVR